MRLDRNFQEISKKMNIVKGGFDGLGDALSNLGGGINPDLKTIKIPKPKSKTITHKKTSEPTPTTKSKTTLEPEIENDKDKEESTEEELKLLKAEFAKNNQQVLDDLLEAYEFFDEKKILEERRETIINLYDDLRVNKNETKKDKENYKNTNKELRTLILDLSDDEEFRSIKYHDIHPIKNKLTGVVGLLADMEKQLSDIDKIKEKEELVKNKDKDKKEQEIINKYFYKEAVSQIIIHGVEVGDEEDGEKETHLKHKLDFDVSSAMKLMELGGVKFAEGSKTSWINPKEKLQYDEDGKPYFNSNDKEKTRLYLEPGTVVLDVAGTYGVSVMDGDIIQIDHHGEIKKYITSTTKELFDVLKDNLEFQKNIKENTNTENLIWLENYVDFVTKVDNLDYDVNPKNWETHYNTMYAVQRYVNSINPNLIFDLFRNYEKINLDGFNKEELEYPIAIGERFYNPKTKREEIKKGSVSQLRYKGEIKEPEFFEKHPVYKNNLLYIKDIVEIQKRAILNTNKAIEDDKVVMFMNNLNENSKVLGKILIDEIDNTDKEFRNNFGAIGAYGHGYDSYLILNLNGNQKNEIFVSTKKNPKIFVDKIKKAFRQVLVENYTDDLVVQVRDSMVVVRGKSLKQLETDNIRGIMARALEIDGYTVEDRYKDIIKEIEKSNERTKKLLNS